MTAAVLVAVYLAVETARHVKLSPPAVLYAALIASLLLTRLIPQEDLVSLPIAARFLAGGALACVLAEPANRGAGCSGGSPPGKRSGGPRG